MQAAQFRYVAHFLAISKIPTNCRAGKTESVASLPIAGAPASKNHSRLRWVQVVGWIEEQFERRVESHHREQNDEGADEGRLELLVDRKWAEFLNGLLRDVEEYRELARGCYKTPCLVKSARRGRNFLEQPVLHPVSLGCQLSFAGSLARPKVFSQVTRWS